MLVLKGALPIPFTSLFRGYELQPVHIRLFRMVCILPYLILIQHSFGEKCSQVIDFLKTTFYNLLTT